MSEHADDRLRWLSKSSGSGCWCCLVERRGGFGVGVGVVCSDDPAMSEIADDRLRWVSKSSGSGCWCCLGERRGGEHSENENDWLIGLDLTCNAAAVAKKDL
jgi:hypothetical protein